MRATREATGHAKGHAKGDAKGEVTGAEARPGASAPARASRRRHGGVRAALRGAAQTGAVMAAIAGLGLAAAGGASGGAYTRPPMASQRDPGPASQWLVDGFNVLHSGLRGGPEPSRWWSEAGRAHVLARVARFPAGGARVCVVFDGPRPGAAPEAAAAAPGPAAVQVVFAPDADAWLLAQVAAAPDPGALVVVTADRKLADRARHRGAQVVSPQAFLERCGDESTPG